MWDMHRPLHVVRVIDLTLQISDEAPSQQPQTTLFATMRVRLGGNRMGVKLNPSTVLLPDEHVCVCVSMCFV
jgi:hypothetical protein